MPQLESGLLMALADTDNGGVDGKSCASGSGRVAICKGIGRVAASSTKIVGFWQSGLGEAMAVKRPDCI